MNNFGEKRHLTPWRNQEGGRSRKENSASKGKDGEVAEEVERKGKKCEGSKKIYSREKRNGSRKETKTWKKIQRDRGSAAEEKST